MNELMHMAIRCRMAFSPDDGHALVRLSHRTCVGVFDPMAPSFYDLACGSGGTYARMWEKAHKMQPWIAARSMAEGSQPRIDERVAPGIAVLIRGQDGDDCIPRVGPYQVWWCTSMDADRTLRLGRYRLEHPQSNPLVRGKRPVQLLAFTRSEWDALQIAERAHVEATTHAA